METIQFNEGQLLERLRQLSSQAQSTFGAACAQRLLPMYSKFAATTGKTDALSSILERLWADLIGDRMTGSQLQKSISECQELLPGEDELTWVPEQGSAEDAVAATIYALQCRRDGDAQNAAWAARRAYEAIDEYVVRTEDVDLNGSGVEDQVRSHPLIQAELARQRRDLNELRLGKIQPSQFWERAKHESSIFLPMSG